MKNEQFEKLSQEINIDEPKKYNVVFLNDDFTPIEIVVAILTQLFSFPQEKSSKLANDIHEKGKAVVGTYTKDVAETKVNMVLNIANMSGHPLQAEIQST